jgi:hypothetical protein
MIFCTLLFYLTKPKEEEFSTSTMNATLLASVICQHVKDNNLFGSRKDTKVLNDVSVGM